MTPKRNRTLNASAGLLTALTLGVASLAGCAPFDPNPVPGAGAQVPSTGTPSSAPVGPGTPNVTPSAAPAATKTISLSAAVNGQPLQNAEVVGIDLATGKSFPLVSAGGLNRRLFATDSQGNTKVVVPANTPKAFKVVIRDTVTKKGVSTIIGTDSAGAFKGIGGAGTDTFNLSAQTTVASNAIEGLFAMAAGAPGQQDSLLNSFFEEGNELAAAAAKLTPEQLEKVAANVDASGAVTSSIMTELTTNNALFKETITASLGQALQSFAAANVTGSSADFSALAADLAILEELGFNVDLTGGELKITGNGVEISIEETEPETPTEPGEEPTVPETPTDPEVEETEDDDEDAIGPGNPEYTADDADFHPEVTMTFNGSSLQLRVTQDDGEYDVDEIVARIPKDTTGADFIGGAATTLASGTGTGGIVSDADSSGSFTVTRDLTIGELDPEYDHAFAVVTEDPDWMGRWMDGSLKVANVNVIEDDDFIYLVIQNAMSSSNDLRVNDHTTTMNVPSSVLSLDQSLLETLEDSESGTVDISIFSRNGDSATFQENIQVNADD